MSPTEEVLEFAVRDTVEILQHAEPRRAKDITPTQRIQQLEAALAEVEARIEALTFTAGVLRKLIDELRAKSEDPR